MIKSEIIKIDKISKFDNIYIEQAIEKLGITPVRWAVVDISKTKICISVSYCT